MEKERKLVEQLSDIDLGSKIRRGRAWLILHSKDLCDKMSSWAYDRERWSYNLKYYEIIVEEATSRGLKEDDCWILPEDFTVDKMMVEEIGLFFIETTNLREVVRNNE